MAAIHGARKSRTAWPCSVTDRIRRAPEIPQGASSTFLQPQPGRGRTQTHPPHQAEREPDQFRDHEKDRVLRSEQPSRRGGSGTWANGSGKVKRDPPAGLAQPLAEARPARIARLDPQGSEKQALPGFGSPRHSQKPHQGQMDELLQLIPKFIDNSNFVHSYLSKLAPSCSVDLRQNDEEMRKWLNRQLGFTRRLSPAFNSLKANACTNSWSSSASGNGIARPSSNTSSFPASPATQMTSG